MQGGRVARRGGRDRPAAQEVDVFGGAVEGVTRTEGIEGDDAAAGVEEQTVGIGEPEAKIKGERPAETQKPKPGAVLGIDVARILPQTEVS